MKKLLLSFVLILASLVFTSNAQTISFSFTTNHSCNYVASDSIFIENLTQGGDTSLYWNDTVLTIILNDINEINARLTRFYVSQNYPNPFETKTDIDVFVPEKDEFSIFVYDMAGREVANYKNILKYGMHNFTFHAGNSKSYILNVQSDKYTHYIQMIQFGQVGNENPQIVYNGIISTEEPEMKTKSFKSYFLYAIGDELRFTCYVSGDNLEITDSPTESMNYLFDVTNETPDSPTESTHQALDNEIEWNWNEIANADGYKYHTTDDYANAIDNGTSTSYTQDGLEICTEYTLYVWAYNNCGESTTLTLTETTTGTVPDKPTADIHQASGNEITWNWNELAGADGYKYNSTNDYATATDNNNSSEFTETFSLPQNCGKQKVLYVWAYNNCGVSEPLFLTHYFEHTFIDNRDDNEYKTVQIGNQCWMTENLKYLPTVVGVSAGSETTPYYYVNGYNGTDVNAAKATENYNNYGVLYNWPAAMNEAESSEENPSGVQGACPAGWHLPSDDEWTELVDYIVSQGYPNEYYNPNGAANALKSCRQVDSPLGDNCDTIDHPRWNSHDTHYGTDIFGFKALPGGFRHHELSKNLRFFDGIGASSFWWSATQYDAINAHPSIIYSIYGDVTNSYLFKHDGFSVRCVKDQ
jgi:uncharacterized protein (TIGR02145 family)